MKFEVRIIVLFLTVFSMSPAWAQDGNVQRDSQAVRGPLWDAGVGPSVLTARRPEPHQAVRDSDPRGPWPANSTRFLADEQEMPRTHV